MTEEISLNNMLTIVINTKNRPKLLNASLNYILYSGLDAQIIITDASPDEVWKINDKSISSLLPKKQFLHLRLRLYNFPENVDKLFELLSMNVIDVMSNNCNIECWVFECITNFVPIDFD